MKFKALRRAVNAGTHKNFSKADIWAAHQTILRVQANVDIRCGSVRNQLASSRGLQRSGLLNQWDPGYHGEAGNTKGRPWAARLLKGKFPNMCAELDRDMDALDTVKRAMGLLKESRPFPQPAPQPDRMVI